MSNDATQRAELHRMVMTDHMCPFGLKTLDLLKREGYEVDDHHLKSRDEVEDFMARNDVKTTPQVFIGDKPAFRWTRLSCRKFRDNEVRLQLHTLAYNLATFLRCIELPEAMADWSLTSLQLKLIKIGARVVRHARAITFQLAEVAVTGPMVRAILAAIRRLRAPPLCT
ncbi:MAG: hypothetical protein EA407_13485 [Rhodobacteraceae bacterium]|nr:MAG: hypothetical protein EA407_13485 [Paracoccaceae bacterium]